jgi:heme/copper-type cytochrome/quinol oxidase subunit 4
MTLHTSHEDHVAENVTVVRTTQARQGETSGRVRYVLIIGLALVIAAFAIIYFLNF